MAESWKDKARDVITAVMRGALADDVDRAEPNRAQHPSEARRMRQAGYVDMFEGEG